MNSNLLACVLVAGSALGFSWQPGGGVDSRPKAAATPTGGQTQPAASSKDAGEPEKKIDIEFAGGTLIEFTDLLDKAAGGTFNIVLAASVRELPVPPISLKQTTAEIAMEALSSSLEGQVNVRIVESRESGVRSVMAVQPSHGMQTHTRSIGDGFEVFPIADRLGTKAEVLAAIEAGLSLMKDSKPPRISFHEASSLLFVVGSQKQVSAVQRVLVAMDERSGRESAKELAWLGETTIQQLRASSAENAASILKEFANGKAALHAAELKLETERATSEAKLQVAKRDSDSAQAMLRERQAEEERARAKMIELLAAERAVAAEKNMAAEACRQQVEQLKKQLDRMQVDREKLEAESSELRDKVRALEAAAMLPK